MAPTILQSLRGSRPLGRRRPRPARTPYQAPSSADSTGRRRPGSLARPPARERSPVRWIRPDPPRLEAISEAAQRAGAGDPQGPARRLGTEDRLALARALGRRRRELPLHGVAGESGCDGRGHHVVLLLNRFKAGGPSVLLND